MTTVAGQFNKLLSRRSPAPTGRSARDKGKLARERAAKEAKEAEERRRRQEYMLILRGVSASGVPEADARNGSDAYVVFELLECDGLEAPPSAQTPPIMNTTEPRWEHAVRLMVPAGSKPAMDQQARLRVSIYDKDLTDEDDLLGRTELFLEQRTGSFEGVTLSGQPPYADCTLSFRYELAEFVPPPPATLILLEASAFDVPTERTYKKKEARAGSPSAAASEKKQKGKGSASGCYIRFTLLEVAEKHAQVGATSAQPNQPNPTWESLDMRLALPKGSPRPPLLRVQLCDDELAADAAGEPLATMDVRLAEGSDGTMQLTLPGRIGFKDVAVRFSFRTVEKK